MLAQGFLILFVSIVQGQEYFSGSSAGYDAYAPEVTTVTKTATFTFTSYAYAYEPYFEKTITNIPVPVLTTMFLKETKVESITRTITLENLLIEPLAEPTTVITSKYITVTSKANLCVLKTMSATRTRTLMHWGQNLIKETVSRTTTVTDKYQVIQMETTIIPVRVTLTHTVTVLNTEFKPSIIAEPYYYAPPQGSQVTSQMVHTASTMRSFGYDTSETNGSWLDIFLEDIYNFGEEMKQLYVNYKCYLKENEDQDMCLVIEHRMND